MKVLHVIAPGPIAGAERVVLCGCRALEDTGIQVVLGVIDDRRRRAVTEAFIEAAVVPSLRLPCRGRLDPGTVGAMWRACRELRPDVVHLHGYKAVVYGLPLRLLGLPLVATHHGESAHDAKVRVFEAAQVAVYRLLHRVVAVSDAVAVRLRAAGVPASRLRTVPNPLGLDLGGLGPPPPDTGELRLLYLGRLSIEKGLDVLLQALPGLRAPVRVTIVGDGPERRALEVTASELGIEDRVRFAGYDADVRPHLAATHVLVLPSRREGLPMALIEAACAGRPVVASRVGGIPELVQNGHNGLLVDPDDPAALAGAIETMYREYREHRRAALEMAGACRECYGPDRWARATLAVYREVVST